MAADLPEEDHGPTLDSRPTGKRVRLRLQTHPAVIRCIERFVRQARPPKPMMPQMTGAGLSHPGRVRTNNEDDWRYEPALRVAVVADGMGGAACGEIASSLTVAGMINHLWLRQDAADRGAALVEAVREANRSVWERARTENACQGMGSTVVAVAWKGNRLWVVNVGDSRAYLFRRGTLEQLSHDQTLLNEIRDRMQLNEAQVANFPHKHVLTQAIGAQEEITVRRAERQLEDGDEVLLCSDGLSGPVDDDAMAAILALPAPLESRLQMLIDRALEAGGPDNVTAVLLHYGR